jgi:hypothetical protein
LSLALHAGEVLFGSDREALRFVTVVAEATDPGIVLVSPCLLNLRS